jgi:fatty acid-binding protein DegV
MRTTIVTDSSAWYDVGADDAVRAVSIGISLPSAEGVDATIGADRIRAAMAGDEPVKTKAPSAIDYLTAIEASDADAVAVLTPAAAVTAMWQNACAAVYLSDRPAAVVDTGTAAAAQRLVVEAAAAAAAGGDGIAEVVRVAEQAARRAQLVAVLGSLEPIRRSGILPGSAGSRHRHHTLFRFTRGAIEPLDPPGPSADPAVILRRAWERAGGSAGDRAVVFTSGAAGATDAAGRLASALGARGPVAVSPSVVAYTGPEVLGVAWLAGSSG